MAKSPDKLTAVAIAQRWIGTDYAHQASLEGIGADCLGLFRGVWRELFGVEPIEVPPYSEDWSVADGTQMVKTAGCIMDAVTPDAAEPGDIALLRMRQSGPVKHMGILGQRREGLTLIHAYSLHGVVETHFSAPWRRRVHSFYALPFRN